MIRKLLKRYATALLCIVVLVSLSTAAMAQPIFKPPVIIVKPTAPTNLRASDIKANSVLLSWSASSNADGYNVYFSTTQPNSDFSNMEKAAFINASTLSYNVTGLQPSTKYYFAVKAWNQLGGESAPSNVVTVTTKSAAIVVPPPVDIDIKKGEINATAEALSPTEVLVKWTTRDILTLSHITWVEKEGRKVIIGGKPVELKPQIHTAKLESGMREYKITGLEPDTEYVITVHGASEYLTVMDEVEVKTKPEESGTVVVPPPVDIDIEKGEIHATAEALSPTEVLVKWTTRDILTLSHITWVEKEGRKVIIGGKTVELKPQYHMAKLQNGMREYKITGLEPDTEYVITVHGAGQYLTVTDTVEARTKKELPAAPERLRGVVKSSSKVELFWEDCSRNETGFEIYVNNTKLFEVGENKQSATVTGLKENTGYQFRVRAVNEAGGAWSDPITLRTGEGEHDSFIVVELESVYIGDAMDQVGELKIITMAGTNNDDRDLQVVSWPTDNFWYEVKDGETVKPRLPVFSLGREDTENIVVTFTAIDIDDVGRLANDISEFIDNGGTKIITGAARIAGLDSEKRQGIEEVAEGVSRAIKWAGQNEEIGTAVAVIKKDNQGRFLDTHGDSIFGKLLSVTSSNGKARFNYRVREITVPKRERDITVNIERIKVHENGDWLGGDIYLYAKTLTGFAAGGQVGSTVRIPDSGEWDMDDGDRHRIGWQFRERYTPWLYVEVGVWDEDNGITATTDPDDMLSTFSRVFYYDEIEDIKDRGGYKLMVERGKGKDEGDITLEYSLLTPGGVIPWRYCFEGGKRNSETGKTPPQVRVAAPTQLEGFAAGPNAVELHWWDKSDNETRFEIRYGTNRNNLDNIKCVPSNTVTTLVEGLRHNTNYYFEIRAVSDSSEGEGVSDASNRISVRTSDYPPAVHKVNPMILDKIVGLDLEIHTIPAAPPKCISALASDTGNNPGIGEGDSITFTFDKDTNKPQLAIHQLDTQLRLSEGFTWGTGAKQVRWEDARTLVVTFGEGTNANLVPGSTIIHFDGAGIKSPDSSYTRDSAVLMGSFGAQEAVAEPTAVGPVLVDAVASDTGNAPGINQGDTLTLVFDAPTNEPAISGADLDEYFLLDDGNSWGSGQHQVNWVEPNVLEIVISGEDGVVLNPGCMIALSPQAAISSAEDANLLATGTAFINGSFGEASGPRLIGAVAQDAGENPGLGEGDAIFLVFDSPTNQAFIDPESLDEAFPLPSGKTWGGGAKTVLWYDEQYLVVIFDEVEGANIAEGDTVTVSNISGIKSADGTSFVQASSCDITESFGAPAQQIVFTDTQGHWADQFIRELVNRGITQGYPGGLFKPQNTLTRAEFVTFIMRSIGEGSPAQPAANTFADTAGHWGSSFIERAVELGVIVPSEYPNRQFKPDQNIAREDIAAMIIRALNVIMSPTPADESQLTFNDRGAISQRRREHVSTAVSLGIIAGYEDNTFKPTNNATRAEAATMLIRMLNVIEEQ